MPKVSAAVKKSPAGALPGRKGLSHRAASDADLTADGADDDQFKDAPEESKADASSGPDVPALPPIKADREKRDGKKKGPALPAAAGFNFNVANIGVKPAPAAKVPTPPPAADDSKEVKPSGSGEGQLLSDAPPASLSNDFRGGQESWNAMLYQLLLYKAQRGDLNIPHNDTSYRLLYNWVQTQRKHYKLYQENKTSSTFLNADRIAVLDAIDFQWNVRGDTFWQKNFDALVVYKNEHGDVRVPRLYTKNPKLGEWVTDQRRQWKAKMDGKPNMMTEERKAKLDEMGFVWKVRDRADWNDRYEQLLEFKKENGHCIVPQHYTRNRALGKWVAKQREQYRFYREGKHSFLTEERIDLLKSVGFVWQIKGRGIHKKLPGKSPAGGGVNLNLNDDSREKSLAKIEEEEAKKKAASGMAMATIVDDVKMKSPPSLPASLDASIGGVGASLGLAGLGDPGSALGLPGLPGLPKPDGDKKGPSLPAISQQQLLQANMAAIAAHASSNQNMVADLAAALRLGGGANPAPSVGAPGITDPRVAALRAQLGSDPKNFTTSMI